MEEDDRASSSLCGIGRRKDVDLQRRAARLGKDALDRPARGGAPLRRHAGWIEKKTDRRYEEHSGSNHNESNDGDFLWTTRQRDDETQLSYSPSMN
jgi:hypothetical protein